MFTQNSHIVLVRWINKWFTVRCWLSLAHTRTIKEKFCFHATQIIGDDKDDKKNVPKVGANTQVVDIGSIFDGKLYRLINILVS